MKIIIKFEGSNEVFKKALNKEVNGFINQCLGKDNPYHGNFSRYCISSMQGGRMNKNGELLFSYALNEETPLLLEYSSYDDKLGLALNDKKTSVEDKDDDVEID